MINSTSNKQVKRVANLRDKAKARREEGVYVAEGLTDEMAAIADTYIKIPMAGRVESLNAAVASSVLMFEAARQRRNV